MKAICYLLANSEAELMRAQHAAIQYGAARGWPKLPSESWGSVATKPGEYLPETLNTLAAGDVLLIPNVSVLGERPSQIEDVIRQTIGRGIRLHTLDLGDINAHLPGLLAAFASCASVETELDTAVADLAAAEERHKEDLEQFQESLYQRVMSEGLTFTVGGKTNGANGHANVGNDIKSKREKMNLSQRQLAELSGVSHSQVQRIEQHGKGEGLEAVLKALGMEGEHATAPAA
jgi:DNA-binding transcriptional regulator YiaG